MTEPDTETNERWEAAQVWAHMAEFVPYWQGQAEHVAARFDGEAVPFGRVKSDALRIAAVEAGRGAPIDELSGSLSEALGAFRRYVEGLGPVERRAVGRHPTLGEMEVEEIIGRFVVDHLEEHLEQLDRLDAGP